MHFILYLYYCNNLFLLGYPNPEEMTDSLLDLPEEMIVSILVFLSHKSLLSLSLVNTNMLILCLIYAEEKKTCVTLSGNDRRFRWNVRRKRLRGTVHPLSSETYELSKMIKFLLCRPKIAYALFDETRKPFVLNQMVHIAPCNTGEGYRELGETSATRKIAHVISNIFGYDTQTYRYHPPDKFVGYMTKCDYCDSNSCEHVDEPPPDAVIRKQVYEFALCRIRTPKTAVYDVRCVPKEMNQSDGNNANRGLKKLNVSDCKNIPLV
jgi:hypothetical protein